MFLHYNRWEKVVNNFGSSAGTMPKLLKGCQVIDICVRI